jgi:hypothetical protein
MSRCGTLHVRDMRRPGGRRAAAPLLPFPLGAVSRDAPLRSTQTPQRSAVGHLFHFSFPVLSYPIVGRKAEALVIYRRDELRQLDPGGEVEGNVVPTLYNVIIQLSPSQKTLQQR